MVHAEKRFFTSVAKNVSLTLKAVIRYIARDHDRRKKEEKERMG